MLQLRGDQVTVEPAAGVKLTLAGARPGDQDQPQPGPARLKPDLPGPPDVLALGDLRFFVIVRDGRIGVRLRDLRNPARAAFKGIEHFPVRPEYRVVARYVPHPAGKTDEGAQRARRQTDMANPGKVEFQLAGKPLSLDAVLEEPTDTQLFLIFKDQTAGKETYGAGRFVYTDALPRLDKPVRWCSTSTRPTTRRARSPPTPPARCRRPRTGCKLRIEAGEKRVAGPLGAREPDYVVSRPPPRPAPPARPSGRRGRRSRRAPFDLRVQRHQARAVDATSGRVALRLQGGQPGLGGGDAPLDGLPVALVLEASFLRLRAPACACAGCAAPAALAARGAGGAWVGVPGLPLGQAGEADQPALLAGGGCGRPGSRVAT